MQIKKHYHVDNTLQRSIVEHNGLVLRRINRWVTPAGELTPTILENAVWQERFFTGDFHNATESISRAYERLFIAALIEQNRGCISPLPL